MALDKVITIKVNGKEELTTLDALVNRNVQSFGELEDRKDALEQAFKQVDFGSKEFNLLQKSLRDTNSSIESLETSIEAVKPGELAEGLVNFGQAAMGAFTIASAAATAFGDELGLSAEEVEKAQLKMQSLIAVMEGMQAISRALSVENKLFSTLMGKSAVQLTANTAATEVNTAAMTANATATTGAAAATGILSKAWKAFLLTSMIGAVVLALGYVIGHFDKIKEFAKPLTDKLAPAFRAVGKAIDYMKDKARNFLSLVTGGLIDDAATAKTMSNIEKIGKGMEDALNRKDFRLEFQKEFTANYAEMLQKLGQVDEAAAIKRRQLQKELGAAKKEHLDFEKKLDAEYLKVYGKRAFELQTLGRKVVSKEKDKLDNLSKLYQKQVSARMDLMKFEVETAQQGLDQLKTNNDLQVQAMEAGGASQYKILQKRIAQQKAVIEEARNAFNEDNFTGSTSWGDGIVDNVPAVKQEIVKLKELQKQLTEYYKEQSEKRIKQAEKEAKKFLEQFDKEQKLRDREKAALQHDYDLKKRVIEDNAERLAAAGATELEVKEYRLAEYKNLSDEELDIAAQAQNDYNSLLENGVEIAQKIYNKEAALRKTKNATEKKATQEYIKVLRKELDDVHKLQEDKKRELEDAKQTQKEANTEVLKLQKDYNDDVADNAKELTEKKREELEQQLQDARDFAALEYATTTEVGKKNGEDPTKTKVKAAKDYYKAQQEITGKIIQLYGTESKAFKEQALIQEAAYNDLTDALVERFQYVTDQIGTIGNEVANTINDLLEIQIAANELQLDNIESQMDLIQERLGYLDAELQVRYDRMSELSDLLKQDQGSGGTNAVVEQLEAEKDAIRALNKEKLEQKKREQELAKERAKIEAQNLKMQETSAKVNAISTTVQTGLAIASLAAQSAKQDFTFGIATVASIAALTGALIGSIAQLKSAFKFADGGYTKASGPRDETGFRVAGVVHEDEWVAPKWQVESPTYGPIIRELEEARRSGRRFDAGGFTSAAATSPAQIPSGPDPNILAVANSMLALAQRPVITSVKDTISGIDRVNSVENRATV